MYLRRVLALTALGVGLTASVATSYAEPCTWGAWPIDGATAVPLDVQIVFQGEWLDETMPAFTEDVVSLVSLPGGERVDVDVDVDFEENAVVLTPREPLRPDQAYRATGVAVTEQASVNYVADDFLTTVPASVTFTTASDPTLLAVHVLRQDMPELAEIVLVASQPVDAASVADDTLVLEAPADMAAFAPTWAGFYEGEPHMLAFQVEGTEEALQHLSGSLAVVTSDLLAEDGEAFSADDPVTATLATDTTLAVYRGLLDCRWGDE